MAAAKAVGHIKDGQIIGLGSGTTVACAIEEIARRIQEEDLKLLGVPTSNDTYYRAIDHSIPLTTLDVHPQLDLVIDGADQVDTHLMMIKGMGGAFVREKIIAFAAQQNIVIIDESKMTHQLGADQPIPIEVLPFALSLVRSRLRKLGGTTKLRKSERKLGPVMSDNGNYILDTAFGPIESPKNLDQALKDVPGVIDTGLFIDIADIIYVGKKDTVQKLKRKN
jgi:ribose 5-phosphate isomerase A